VIERAYDRPDFFSGTIKRDAVVRLCHSLSSSSFVGRVSFPKIPSARFAR
jgi:hypothetical protein